ncbi:hypothetical protein AURDEDRAFT_71338 [Auricularia subglabra TFB-10046 SS5]|nr:hypothetical protein AURDEDRAFT_71338 [Auricularia subglabra TFB-10046 SS5]
MTTITHLLADLFAAPRSAILVHACNTQGSWGGGIAVEFHARYPAAFNAYREHCRAHDSDAIIGTCLLIPGVNDEHDVACLFTSRRYGARKDKPQQILEATESALRDLMKQNVSNKEIHACKFNSGKFGVPWSETEDVIRRVGASMLVYTPPGEREVEESTTGSSRTSKRAPSSSRGPGRGRGRGGSRQTTLGAFGMVSHPARSARRTRKSSQTSSQNSSP